MNAVGSLLSEYRKRNHLSQLDLGMLAEVSARHISFIETGKSMPSRDMLLKLADSLNLSLHDSNLLLNSCGFASAFSHFELGSPEMEPVRQALAMMLEKQNPYPALVIDGDWNILMINSGQQFLAQELGIKAKDNGSNNVLVLGFRSGLLPPPHCELGRSSGSPVAPPAPTDAGVLQAGPYSTF